MCLCSSTEFEWLEAAAVGIGSQIEISVRAQPKTANFYKLASVAVMGETTNDEIEAAKEKRMKKKKNNQKNERKQIIDFRWKHMGIDEWTDDKSTR